MITATKDASNSWTIVKASGPDLFLGCMGTMTQFNFPLGQFGTFPTQYFYSTNMMTAVFNDKTFKYSIGLDGLFRGEITLGDVTSVPNLTGTIVVTTPFRPVDPNTSGPLFAGDVVYRRTSGPGVSSSNIFGYFTKYTVDNTIAILSGVNTSTSPDSVLYQPYKTGSFSNFAYLSGRMEYLIQNGRN